eukprot:1420070-Rhodomonas_salina.2
MDCQYAYYRDGTSSLQVRIMIMMADIALRRQEGSRSLRNGSVAAYRSSSTSRRSARTSTSLSSTTEY